MRIAILSWTSRRVGGAEATLGHSLPGILRSGHQVGFWCEMDRPQERPPLTPGDLRPVWCVEELGRDRALADLASWRPDVLYMHGLLDPSLERAALRIAPAVLFAHAYHGTCISGAKAFSFPRARPCPHPFGWRCLLRYYPRRTGGLSPFSMVREYGRQAQRLKTLRAYRAILVLSEHMRAEYSRHGVPPHRLVRLPPPPMPLFRTTAFREPRRAGTPWRLLFVGRMDRLKGGAVLLEAAPHVARALGAPIRVTFVGDGPARRAWETKATALVRREPQIEVHFAGWCDAPGLEQAYGTADLLVMPSLWPEPFGLAGLEAGGWELPCTAFAVGGIPEWLKEGVNGTLAPADPPTTRGLAEAIVRALGDADRHQGLRAGALAAAQAAAGDAHLTHVLAALARAATSSG